MPYDPGVVNRSGEILAQSRLAGGMAALGGLSEGFETYQKNKLQNQILSSENEALIAGLQQLQQMKVPGVSQMAPPGMDRLIKRHLEGGGLNLNDAMKLNAMLGTTLKTAQTTQAMQAQATQRELQDQALRAKLAEGEQAVADVKGFSQILKDINEQGKQATLENIAAAAARLPKGLSPAAFDSITQGLGRLATKPVSIEALRYQSQQEKDAAEARIKTRADQIALGQQGSPLANKAEENAAMVAASKIYEAGLRPNVVEETNPQTGRTEFFTETRDITGKLVGRKPVYAPNLTPEEQATAAEQVATAQSAVKWVDQFSENASSAGVRLAKNKAALALLESNKVQTGPGAPIIQIGRRLFAAYGGDPKTIADTANFGLLTNLLGEQVFEYFSRTKGAISDYESKQFANLAAKENKTVAENVAILKIAVLLDERTQAANKALRQAIKNGEVKTARDQRMFIEDYVDSNPIDFNLIPAQAVDPIIERNLRRGGK